LGVVVRSDIVLVGLKGKKVTLSWSMWSKDGSKRLSGDWLNDTLAYELEATTARDTASVELWVPLPKQVGKYIIRSTLRIDGSDIASATSDEFE